MIAPVETSGPQGYVFDIKRFAVHDGPGVRTTVFLKGCNLRCVWCHNPESINPEPELLVHPNRCIGCDFCSEVCPTRAHKLSPGGERVYDRSGCRLCGRCVESCYSGALEMAGRKVSVVEVLNVVKEDALFYEISGGGVTLSGGEPLLQGEFATALLKQCKEEGFHTAIDTCGQVPWRIIEGALPYIDMFLYDLKHISPRQHKRYTGASNQVILDNLRRLRGFSVPIEIRMPIIPTINDSREDIESAARLLASLRNITLVTLLPYHRLAGSKYKSLGKKNTLPAVSTPSRDRLKLIASWINKYGLKVEIQGSSL